MDEFDTTLDWGQSKRRRSTETLREVILTLSVFYLPRTQGLTVNLLLVVNSLVDKTSIFYLKKDNSMVLQFPNRQSRRPERN